MSEYLSITAYTGRQEFSIVYQNPYISTEREEQSTKYRELWRAVWQNAGVCIMCKCQQWTYHSMCFSADLGCVRKQAAILTLKTYSKKPGHKSKPNDNLTIKIFPEV